MTTSRSLAGFSAIPALLCAVAAVVPVSAVAATPSSRDLTQDRAGPAGEATPAPRAAAATPLVQLAQNDGPRIAAGNPAIAPLKWAGLWFWATDDTHVGTCTAQFITDRVILLAAHCVRDHATGVFTTTNDKNSGFLLQYQNSDYSKEYHAICKATWNEWVAPLHSGEDPSKPETMTPERQKEYSKAFMQSWQWDYAFILLDAPSITGHYNYSINMRWNSAVSTGYPGKLMGGQVIQELRGDVFSEADLSYSLGDEGNEQVLWHGNPDHTQGSSGGAWVVHIDSKASPDTNLIVGLNSFGVDSKPGANFGPLFTDRFQTLLNFVSNGCQ